MVRVVSHRCAGSAYFGQQRRESEYKGEGIGRPDERPEEIINK